MEITLFEELSISNDIKREAEQLIKIILFDSNKADKIKYDDFNDVLSNSFKISLFNIEYTINYKIFDINSSKEFNEHLFKLLTPITRNNIYKIDLFLLTINNIPDNNLFYAPIYHELTHVYQYIKSQNNVLSNPKTNKLYALSKNIKEQNIKSQIIFAYAIYASFDFEQDALIHELYGECMHQQEIYTLHQYIWMDSNAYGFINDLTNAIEQIDNLDEKLFENSKNYYLDLFNQKLNRFKNKLGKLEIKIKKDFYEKHLNEGLLPSNIKALSIQIKEDSENIKNYIDDEIF